ncbi:ferredoxin [Pseudooceanicola aestuarii]|uniref:ferredoxin n=1 Tax=Pseudooceanicola aestuarii TaxID=2697319 RepID=UPI001EF95907|nr:ferredoxin [Pseudooceanicola aestuarii]
MAPLSSLGIADWDRAARPCGLRVSAALHPAPDPALPAGTGTLLLLSPKTPRFWAIFTASAEYRDGAEDPMDRWSRRVINALTRQQDGACAVFPFDGPPYAPFYDWARVAGGVQRSPVTLLADAEDGLHLAFRGALALPATLPLPAPRPAPCTGCIAPCATACPAGALTPAGYDVPACRAWLETEAGKICLHHGCQVREACPPARARGRVLAQNIFHMRHFTK